MTHVSILIPTFRRPASFLRAARSALAQRGVSSFEIVAIDNSPEGSALAVFHELEAAAEAPFRWAHEPRPGVAFARNAAVKLARGELVAWLDDDEEAAPGWLSALVGMRTSTGAQSVFGPVSARVDSDIPNADFYERLYTRRGPPQDGVCARAYGIGNSLQPRSLFDEPEPFDSSTDQSGGEDDVLFAAWARAGATFAWASGATVVEHIGPERTNLRHGLRRAFAYGQAPCETAWAAREFLDLARHMSIGAAQALVFGGLSAVVALASTSRALALLDRAARGAGKVFWFCEQRFYGQALLDQPA